MTSLSEVEGQPTGNSFLEISRLIAQIVVPLIAAICDTDSLALDAIRCCSQAVGT
ncbi:MAG: hypothetical protein SFW36_17875 [Leptolyngbyaceae cyanobacterium bins.59]|nr:hypothetical protein [Leptolyngbyaceae cyanobacterium bins.59]